MHQIASVNLNVLHFDFHIQQIYMNMVQILNYDLVVLKFMDCETNKLAVRVVKDKESHSDT